MGVVFYHIFMCIPHRLWDFKPTNGLSGMKKSRKYGKNSKNQNKIMDRYKGGWVGVKETFNSCLEG